MPKVRPAHTTYRSNFVLPDVSAGAPRAYLYHHER